MPPPLFAFCTLPQYPPAATGSPMLTMPNYIRASRLAACKLKAPMSSGAFRIRLGCVMGAEIGRALRIPAGVGGGSGWRGALCGRLSRVRLDWRTWLLPEAAARTAAGGIGGGQPPIPAGAAAIGGT